MTTGNPPNSVQTDVLLPCPFHADGFHKLPPTPSSWMMGRAAELQTREDVWAHQVRCYCGAQGPECDTEAEAITAWNTRALTNTQLQRED